MFLRGRYFVAHWQHDLLVIVLFMLDSAQSIFSLNMTFIQMASGWGNTDPLFSPGFSFDMIPILSGISKLLFITTGLFVYFK